MSNAAAVPAAPPTRPGSPCHSLVRCPVRLLRARAGQLHCLSLHDVHRFGFETLWRFAPQSSVSAVAAPAAVKAIRHGAGVMDAVRRRNSVRPWGDGCLAVSFQ